MNCPNCDTPLQREACTYTGPSGSLLGACIYHCEDCGYEIEVRRGKRHVVFDGVREVDREIGFNLGEING